MANQFNKDTKKHKGGKINQMSLLEVRREIDRLKRGGHQFSLRYLQLKVQRNELERVRRRIKPVVAMG